MLVTPEFHGGRVTQSRDQ